ncbi:MAG: DUF4339 domain-containing protein [Rickettsiales bacterium]|nr:DUF4339 domain-containing protein [Rickettsiales bacterium]
MGFYIKYETHQDGPFDLVTMIRKIRKGLIPSDTLVMEETEDNAQPARLHPQLNSFYRELEDDYVSDEAATMVEHLNFGAIIAYGWDFFTNNLIAGMLSGLFIFATLCYGLIILIAAQGSFLPSILLIAIAAVFFLCGFIFLLQRLQRQLPFSLHSVRNFYRDNWTNLILFSLAFSIIHVAALSLLIIPGVILLARSAFAPILVVEKNYHFWHAIEASNRTVTNHGTKLYSTLLALVGINLIAAIFIFPLLITLPITFAGVLELYNQLDFS